MHKMSDISAAFLVKIVGLALIPVAFSLWWTTIQLLRGDSLAFRQAKESHPKILDAIFGKAMKQPVHRPDAPLNDGIVLKTRAGRSYWYLNRRMSDEQYDRLTK
jgi:hypothetical protein